MKDDRDDYGEGEGGRDLWAERESEVEREPLDERREVDGSDSRAAPSSPAPETDPTAGSSPPPEPTDNWVAITLGLALASLLTAAATAAIHDAVLPAAGAAVLALGFGAIAAGSLTTFPGIVGLLEDAWAENRLYVWFATALFSFGIAIGGLLVAAGIDLTELFFELLMEEFDEDELTGENGLEFSASFFIFQNTPPFLAAIFGALTLGLLTVTIMLVNGILVGNVATVAGAEMGFGPLFLLLAPHGIFELSALFVAAGIGFRLLHRGVQRIAGSREVLFTKAYLSRTVALTVFAWLVLVLAAFVEAYLTEVIAVAVFPEIGD